jgi:hypothetical protein
MSVATGAQRRICHVTESSWGVPSGTAFKIDRVLQDGGGEVTRDSWASDEMRSDRSIASMRMGVKRPAFSHPFELSYGTQEDQLASAFYSSWVAAKTAISSLSVIVVAGSTNTMAATGIGGSSGSLVAVGDYVKVSGFTGGYTANNGYFRVTARTADLLTLGEAKDTSGASTLAACSSQSGITVQAMGYLVTGTTEQSLAYEENFGDITVFAEYLGCVVKSMSLSIPTTGIIKGRFDLIGKSLVGPAGTTYTASTIAATTTDPMDSAVANCALRIDGTPVAIATSLDINLDNGGDWRLAAFQSAPTGIKVGRSRLSGNLALNFTASTYWTKYLAETAIALGGVLMDPLGATGYAFDIPNVKIASFPKPSITENDSVSNISWQALRDSTLGYANWKIHKLA